MNPVELIAGGAPEALALWAGLNVLLLLGLSGVVVRRRRKHLIAFGHGGQPELLTATRAHANAAEYIPAGLICLGVLVAVGAPAVLIHGLGGTLLLGRAVHACGLIFQKPGASLGRVVGMLLTWIALLIAAVMLLAYAVG
jgi:LPXTG-motif cell wall-anchored protein